jgi:general secretion pathway protein D
VQDGHTLVIGGIIDERIRQERSGLPLLSKIPVLGYLFGVTTDNVQKSELIVMVTPHVVSSSDEADLLTEEYKNRLKDVKRKIDEINRQADIHVHKPGEEKPGEEQKE